MRRKALSCSRPSGASPEPICDSGICDRSMTVPTVTLERLAAVFALVDARSQALAGHLGDPIAHDAAARANRTLRPQHRFQMLAGCVVIVDRSDSRRSISLLAMIMRLSTLRLSYPIRAVRQPDNSQKSRHTGEAGRVKTACPPSSDPFRHSRASGDPGIQPVALDLRFRGDDEFWMAGTVFTQPGRPVPMAEMGPGLRREGNKGKL